MIYRMMTLTEIQEDLLQDDFAAWTHEGAAALAQWLIDYAAKTECSTGPMVYPGRTVLRDWFAEYHNWEDFIAHHWQSKNCALDELGLPAWSAQSDVSAIENALFDYIEKRGDLIRIKGKPGFIADNYLNTIA